MRKIGMTLALFAMVVSASGQSLTKRYQNVLDDRLYDYIVAESSGEKALNSAADLASYELPERNYNALRESEYVLQKLADFGLKTAKLNRYDGASAWGASKGILMEIAPNYRKLADVTDLPAQLCPGSKSVKLDSVELVWVGSALQKELDAVDLKGKIAFGDAPAYQMHDGCVAKGALGVVSCYAFRLAEEGNPLEVVNLDLYAEKPTFGFQLSARDAYPLRDRLKNGEKIHVSAEIESRTTTFQYQSPECVIEGEDPQSGEILFSAHLFEGYNKLGANDNTSGAVVLLEVARTLNTLIEQGKLPRPKRSIRFLWGDEFRGIIPWANTQKETLERILFNVNLDMVGIGLSKGDSQYVLHRNRMATAHYSDDLAEAMMEYLWVTNQKGLITGDFPKPVMAKNGTNDLFRYAVSSYFPPSDHSVFCDWGVGVPAIMMITWPDKRYHSSCDRVEYLDATQLKRAAVIAATIAYTAATATEKEAMQFAGLSFAGASKRLGILTANRFDALQENNTKEQLKRALNDVDALRLVETKAICSVQELDAGTSLKLYTTKLSEQLAIQCEAAKNALSAYCETKNGKTETVLTSAEKRAASIFYKTTPKVKEGGYNVFKGWSRGLIPERKATLNRLGIAEANDLTALTANSGWSLYELKKIYDYEHLTDISLESVETFLDMLVKDGYLEKIKNKE